MAKFFRWFSKLFLILIIVALILPPLSWVLIQFVYTSRIIEADQFSSDKVAIVFGAGLQRDGTPSPILRDRVSTAVDLLKAGKVQKILLSGDNRFIEYNEPGAMQEFALQLGASQEALVLDYAGRRTYDTCYRAKHIFQVDSAVLVTQKYHLPRALFLCDQIGISSVGVPSDLREYSKRSYQIWVIREVFATANAIWDAWIAKPLPVLGEQLPIFTDK